MMPGAGDLDFARHRRLHIAQSIDRTAQRVHDAADQRRPDRHFEHARRPADVVTLAQREVVAENDGADVVLFQVEGQRGHRLARLRRSDLEHLARHRPRQPVNSRDAVADLENGPDFLSIDVVQIRRFDLTQQDVFDLAWSQRRISGHGQSGGSGQRVRTRRPRGDRCGWSGRQNPGTDCEKYHKPAPLGRGRDFGKGIATQGPVVTGPWMYRSHHRHPVMPATTADADLPPSPFPDRHRTPPKHQGPAPSRDWPSLMPHQTFYALRSVHPWKLGLFCSSSDTGKSTLLPYDSPIAVGLTDGNTLAWSRPYWRTSRRRSSIR